MAGLSAWIHVFRDLNKGSVDDPEEHRLVEEAIHERLGQESNSAILALYETVTGESVPQNNNKVPPKEATRTSSRLPAANPENDGKMHWFNR